MKVSVVVTTYNRPDALVRVLDGLLAQSRLPDQIVVADDGSTQETRQALVPYVQGRSPEVLHVWQADEGFRAAMSRNRAILACSGDYLVLLDGDCIPQRQFIQDHLDLARPGYFFQGKRVLVNEQAAPGFTFRDTTSFFRQAGMVITGGLSNGHHILRMPFLPALTARGLSGIRSCNMGLYMADVAAVNGFNHDFTGWGREDSEFVIRLYRYGLKRLEHPFRAICYHLWHRENPRDSLEKNDRLMEEIQGGATHYCPRGLDSLRQENQERIKDRES